MSVRTEKNKIKNDDEKVNSNANEIIALAKALLKWGLLGALVGIMAGSASALFLTLLNWATGYREQHVWLLWLLPLAGVGMGLSYHTFGKSVEAGNNLLLEHIQDRKSVV